MFDEANRGAITVSYEEEMEGYRKDIAALVFKTQNTIRDEANDFIQQSENNLEKEDIEVLVQKINGMLKKISALIQAPIELDTIAKIVSDSVELLKEQIKIANEINPDATFFGSAVETEYDKASFKENRKKTKSALYSILFQYADGMKEIFLTVSRV